MGDCFLRQQVLKKHPVCTKKSEIPRRTYTRPRRFKRLEVIRILMPYLNLVLRIDVDFCKRIERAESRGWRSALEYGRDAFPERGLVVTEIGGATVCFAGVDSFFSQTVGAGIDDEVCDEDLEAITAFYHSRGAAAKLIASPVAGDDLSRMLIRHGFTIEEYENALAADLADAPGRRDARIDVCTDPEAWAEHSARAFTNGQNPDDGLLFGSFLMASHPNVCALALRENGDIVTTGCMAVEPDSIAGLFATSTAPPARGRGYQTALIQDRIARAREAGSTIARATAKPGTPSERNFRRAGFEVLYSRTTWVRPRT
jgi:GNAT superfamily N-acetyltransferase